MSKRPELDPNAPVPPPTGEVQKFRQPYIDPRVTDPRALEYKRQLEARKLNTPVGEVPLPPIPRLDQQFDPSRPMTMAEAAQRQRASEFTEENADGGIFQKPPSMPKLLPEDLLPDDARADPHFIRGHGDMLAINQPGLALKYGIVRQGRRYTPQEVFHQTYAAPPTGAKNTRQLRPETIAGLQQLEELQKKAADQSVENEARAGSAGAAENLAGKEVPPEEREKLQDAISRMDDFDFSTFREMMVRDLLNNEEQRRIIRGRCKPIDITSMVVEGVARQEVQIVPGKFWVTFQSCGGDVELALKGLIAEEAKTLDYSVQYYTDKYSMMALAAGIFAINNNPLPNHLDNNGDFDRDAFLKKFKKVSKLPLPMLASLGVNYFWFDVDCRKCFVAENVKNG
jgi:hypothetical protein